MCLRGVYCADAVSGRKEWREKNEDVNWIITSEIRKFLRSIEYIRGTLGADAPVSYISGLMYLALRDSLGDPVEVLGLGRALGMTDARASRIVNYLGEKREHGNKGLGLVRKNEDKFDQRKKYVELTQKGKYFIEGLIDAITGEEMIHHA